MLSEKQPLYSRLSSDSDESDSPSHLETDLRWRRRFYILLCTSLATLISTTVILGGLALRPSCPLDMSGVQQPYSPASGEVKYVNKYLAHDPESARFMGKPRPELDEAWHQLLEGTMIRISEDELAQVGNVTSAPYKDGGYVAGLGISHNLHCLKRIKQYMHRAYYYTGEQDWDELEKHAEHCLEGLRQSVLCQADLSLYTMEWTSHSRVKPTVRVPQAHACVNWPRLHEWMIGRKATWDGLLPAPGELYEG